MYLIGAVSKKDIAAIKKTGYEIEKIIKPQAFNKLFGNKGKGIVDPDAENMAIVYVDVDILTTLQGWASEERSRLEAKIKNELQDLREIVAQEAFENSDLNGMECVGQDGWDIDGDNFIKKFYYKNEETPSGDSEVGSFVVEFKKGTDKIIYSHVNIW